MLASHLRDRINRIAQPVGRAVGRSGISANAITVAGLVLVTVGTVMFAGFHSLYFGAVVVGIGGITDMVDGAVAKATGTESSFGAFLDSTTDRLSDGVLFSGIVWFLIHHPSTGTNTLGIPPSIAILLGLAVLVLGFLTSYIKGRAEAMGYTCNVGVAERGERVFIAACSIFLHVIVPSLALLFVLSAVTVVQRFVHVWGQADPVKGP
jgi:CDP-diacylglycerol--glycerol-3-phosphate 3-phosphatidyltransferase